jgi:hypothetical protein
MVLHGTTYAILFLLFFGARLHSADNSSAAGISFWTVLDLSAGTCVLVVAALRIFNFLRQLPMSRP